ncbi:MAG: hypothetical protein J0L88_03945 [Xanthomonadales bacterium]|nr:hypothetical protein [Xanthomonadales bacterium]
MITALLAWGLPWAAGSGLCVLLGRGLRARWDVAAALGNGLLLGWFLTALLASLLAAADTGHAFARVAPWLGAVAVLAWIAAFVLRRRDPSPASAPLPRVGRIVWWLLVVLVVVRLGVLGGEALLRPTFPWDAWSAWAIKPKTWFLLGHFVPYVDPSTWLADPSMPARTSAVWDYPSLLAWIQVWFASAAGDWNEPRINLAWTGALAALALASYGQWRAIGVGRRLAMVLVYALVSLPLVGAHAALAGYADLWLAAAFGAAVLAWLRWLRRGEAGQLVLAIAFALSLPLIKLEGAVWLLVFSVVVVLATLPVRWRWRVVALALGLIVLGVALGGFIFPMLGLGWVRVNWGQVMVPALGTLDLHWRPVGTAMLSGLLTLPNWHLLWYVVPVVVTWRWRAFAVDRASACLGSLLAACALFLFVLFFFTDASAWAQNYTSANRLVLHLVPTVFSLLALLLQNLSATLRDTGRAPLAPIDRA